MVSYIKSDLGKLDYLALTLNGQEPRIDFKTLQIIDIFCDTFGESQVFGHLCILYSRWSHQKHEIRKRKMAKLDEQVRKDEIRAKLIEKFPQRSAEI